MRSLFLDQMEQNYIPRIIKKVKNTEWKYCCDHVLPTAAVLYPVKGNRGRFSIHLVNKLTNIGEKHDACDCKGYCFPKSCNK